MFCLEDKLMKVIHTADWHLGKILNGKSFLEDQSYILDAFVDAVEAEQPDVVVVAGDLYDTSYPSKEAIQLLESTTQRINLKLGIPMIMINGNHDGRERLEYGAQWFEHADLYIRTQLHQMVEPICIEDTCFYTLPFANVSELQAYFEDPEIDTYQDGLERCLAEMKSVLDPSKTNILISHLTVQGGTRSESERPLSIGTVESVTQQTFDMIDLVMLGHLHHPFSINSEFIHYSGSLLQYSFSEANQPKGYRCVTVDKNEGHQSIFKPLEPRRKLEVIEADYDDVIQERIEVDNKNNYFQFKLQNMSHVMDPMLHLKQIYPNTLSLMNTTHHFAETNTEDTTEIHHMSDIDIIRTFYEYITEQQLTERQTEKLVHIIDPEAKDSDLK